jgi:hypothetical protein
MMPAVEESEPLVLPKRRRDPQPGRSESSSMIANPPAGVASLTGARRPGRPRRLPDVSPSASGELRLPRPSSLDDTLEDPLASGNPLKSESFGSAGYRVTPGAGEFDPATGWDRSRFLEGPLPGDPDSMIPSPEILKHLPLSAKWPIITPKRQLPKKFPTRRSRLVQLVFRLISHEKNSEYECAPANSTFGSELVYFIGRKKTSHPSQLHMNVEPFGEEVRTVSHFHAMIFCRNMQATPMQREFYFYVIGRNGSRVNGEPIEPGRTVCLKNGQIIMLGRLAFEFRINYLLPPEDAVLPLSPSSPPLEPTPDPPAEDGAFE